MTVRDPTPALGRLCRGSRLIRELARAAGESGAEVWLCGGVVRDVALGRPSHDLDAVVTQRARALIGALEKRLGSRAFRFTKRGVTTWRLAPADGDLDVVDASRRGLDRDLARRELTINAMAYSIADGELYDPLGGLSDLRHRRLRPCGDAVLVDDPVRAVRAARFVAELDRFRLHADARRQMDAAAAGLSRSPVERLRPELDRMMAAPGTPRGLRALDRHGLLYRVLPELEPLRSCVAGRGRPDVWTHTLDAVAASGPRSRLPGSAPSRRGDGSRILRWSLLLHDIAKPETLAFRPDGRPSFHGHEDLGARRADSLLRRLRMRRADRERICRLIRLHLRPGHLTDAGPTARALRRLAREAGDDLTLLVHHAACDAKASGSPDGAARWPRLRGVLLALLELSGRPPRALPRLLDGVTLMRELDLAPGPRIGRLLEAIRDAQECGEISDADQALELARRLAGRP